MQRSGRAAPFSPGGRLRALQAVGRLQRTSFVSICLNCFPLPGFPLPGFLYTNALH